MIKIEVLSDKTISEGNIHDLESDNVAWADIVNPTKDELKIIGKLVGLESSAIESLLEENSRPMINNLEKYSVIVFSTPLKEESVKPLVIFISKSTNDFITVRYGESRSINRINSWDVKRKIVMFEKGPTYILFRLMDEILATYNMVIEDIDEKLGVIEDIIYSEENHKEKKLMVEMYNLKKVLIYFQKGLSANREVIASIEKEYGEFLNKKDLSKFRLLYSEMTRLIEITSTYREILTTLLEVHLSTISNSINVTMKKLTAWAALILVPSLIASIYGMNFNYVPKASLRYGFYLALGLMLVSMLILYAYFRRQDWI